ncbi:MAG: hypothetical protein Q8Q41_00830, partial [bacterium]|nr:hypothetical protein [bacterium]
MSAPLLSAIFVAYIVQNLFIFDQITTYIAFFALAGILIYREGDGSASLPQATPPRTSSFPRFVSLVLCVVLGISVLASGYALYAWNFVPLRQAFRFHAVLSTKNGEKIFAATDSFFLPYTFIQAPLRARFIEILYNSDIIPKAQFAPLTNKALAALEETVAREPYEPRNLAALIESYNELAKQDPKFFAKSEEFARKAFALSPNRQGMRYHLSFVLSGMERYEEALALAKETLALDDRIAKAHYQLGLVYGLMAESRNYKGTMEGEAYRREAEREMDLALELGRKEIGTMRDYVGDLGARAALGTTQYYLFLESDLKNMVVFYRAWREPAKVTEVLEILIRYYPANKDYPHDAIVEYRTLRDKEGIIRNAEKLKKLQPSLAESLDIVIDLARKENWEILDTL